MPRVLFAGFKHETNTFSPMPTDRAAYEARRLCRGEEIAAQYRGTATEPGAFLDAAERFGWDLVPVIHADATPAGKVTHEIYEAVVGEIVAALEAGPRPDAIVLALHGAMVAERFDDGEGELLRRVRAAVGPDVPIGASLDLHANVTDAMARHADVLASFRTYPHVDQYETGMRVATMIQSMLEGGPRLSTTVLRGAMLDGADHGRTTAPGPMREVLQRADALAREHPEVLDISINAGFPWADMHDTGPSVLVVGTAAADAARSEAGDLLDFIWSERSRITIERVSVETGIAQMKAALARPAGGPVVIADYADNPGGGGLGDSTALLGALIESGVQNVAFASIADAQSLAACQAAGEGATVDLHLGGKLSGQFQGPLEVQASVRKLSEGRFAYTGPMSRGTQVDLGGSALIRVGGVDIVLCKHRHQALDPGYFTHLGVDPARCAVVVVKSAQHFRAAFAPGAREVIVVDSADGLTSYNLNSLPYRQVRRPIFPLDLD